MYAVGVIKPQDNIQAYLWLSLALESETIFEKEKEKQNKCKELLKHVSQQMTEKQITEAHLMGQKWKPKIEGGDEGAD